MSLWLAKWPNGDIVLAKADSKQEFEEVRAYRLGCRHCRRRRRC